VVQDLDEESKTEEIVDEVRKEEKIKNVLDSKLKKAII